MGMTCRILVFAAASSMFAGVLCAQDSPSLGDVARQQRLEKESAAGKDTQTPRVITNEEVPEHPTPEQGVAASPPDHAPMSPSANGAKQSAERWKAQIQEQKNKIASLQKQIDQMNQSIRYVNHECASARCVQWNERQKEKQQQVERMQAQLDGQKKRLEEMQESARRQGYGNSVYEP